MTIQTILDNLAYNGEAYLLYIIAAKNTADIIGKWAGSEGTKSQKLFRAVHWLSSKLPK